MKELLDILADILIFWPTGRGKQRRENADVRKLPFRKIPDLSQKKDPPKGKQSRE